MEFISVYSDYRLFKICLDKDFQFRIALVLNAYSCETIMVHLQDFTFERQIRI